MSSSTEPQNSLTTPSAPLALRLRPMVESDLPFLTSSWLKSYRDEQACANDIYHAGMSARIGRISEVATVIVACDPLRPGKIYGYIVFEAPGPECGLLTVHYVYVRQEVRRKGIARALFEAAGGHPQRTTLATHRTFRFDNLQQKADLVLDEARVPQLRNF